MRHLSALLGLLLCAACVGPEDTPSNVKDLRVLAMRMDPPELLAETCSTDPAVLADTLVRPVRLTALIPDPAGEGRELDYTLWACASQDDDTCREDRVELARGVTKGGELVVDLFPGPGTSRLGDGTFLVQRILEKDLYNGLGGVRMPLVLWVRGGSEQVYAQKLMVYGCRFFPEMQPNVQPELPDLLLEGEPWVAGVPRELSGPGPFEVNVPELTGREEAYVVPSFELKPVNLQEAWEVAWHTTLGTFSPNQTGGADFGGGVARHRVEWTPPRNAQAQEVRFWVVARDGRGGMSWVERTVKYTP
ncbi:hypothetical protein ATI61_105679 [Archangium gephyra]|uniref:Uncharacterized protein n=1 Tax=Archangium gephyra TaxID=48 RepID=A0AAC8TJ63_9BACT|nr:hypothetical protein [Archangium gephyra]AKJ06331.1 Hypothetical protein AA314_07957 [Archangium gephyra]REG32351.1 hypothetical protein ATI61_105679 [Archangium gephyra]